MVLLIKFLYNPKNEKKGNLFESRGIEKNFWKRGNRGKMVKSEI